MKRLFLNPDVNHLDKVDAYRFMLGKHNIWLTIPPEEFESNSSDPEIEKFIHKAGVTSLLPTGVIKIHFISLRKSIYHHFLHYTESDFKKDRQILAVLAAHEQLHKQQLQKRLDTHKVIPPQKPTPTDPFLDTFGEVIKPNETMANAASDAKYLKELGLSFEDVLEVLNSNTYWIALSEIPTINFLAFPKYVSLKKSLSNQLEAIPSKYRSQVKNAVNKYFRYLSQYLERYEEL
jgi:hypothetical protein